MSLIEIRKRSLAIETIYHEGGPPVETPLKLAAACAVIRNPYAGRYEPCLLYTSPSPRDGLLSRMPSSA